MSRKKDLMAAQADFHKLLGFISGSGNKEIVADYLEALARHYRDGGMPLEVHHSATNKYLWRIPDQISSVYEKSLKWADAKEKEKPSE